MGTFAFLIDAYGHIPNGTRSYYLSRSQPPFFFAMVALLAPGDPAAAYARFLPQLKSEYAFWMEGAEDLAAGAAHRRVVRLDDGSILNRYFDDSDAPRDESYAEDVALARSTPRPPQTTWRDIRAAAESGWDFRSRWFADGRTLGTIDTTEIVPVDLNALMFRLEKAIRAGCERSGDRDCAADFALRAEARLAALDRTLWDPSRGVYLDYRWTAKARIGRVSAATLYPLFTRAASEEQAASVAAAAEQELLAPGGIVAAPVDTGQQWDAPNGWAPLQWIAVEGLRAYGRDGLAEAIAYRFMLNVERVYRETGKLVEKYDVVASDRPGGGGEYPTQDGFGWTNGVMLKLMALYPADADLPSLDRCPAPGGSMSGVCPHHRPSDGPLPRAEARGGWRLSSPAKRGRGPREAWWRGRWATGARPCGRVAGALGMRRQSNGGARDERRRHEEGQARPQRPHGHAHRLRHLGAWRHA